MRDRVKSAGAAVATLTLLVAGGVGYAHRPTPEVVQAGIATTLRPIVEPSYLQPPLDNAKTLKDAVDQLTGVSPAPAK